MNALVIINPVSGTGGRASDVQRRIALAARAFREHRIDGRVAVTEAPRHGYELAKDAAASGVDLVAAWGGDGTINEVASALAFGSTPLAILPSGSGNGLARELGIPRSPGRAFAAVFEGRDRRMDVGELGGRLFFNVAGIGFDALVAERFNAAKGGHRGAVRYVLATVNELRAYVPPRYTIVADGERLDGPALFIAFANGSQYGYGARIAPHAALDDGRLELIVVSARSPWMTMWHARHLFDGTVARTPGVRLRGMSSATVDTEGEMLVHVDGEAFRSRGPLEATVHPAALRIRVP